jgi:16S rRNA (cytosine967-C5)-methyltransferase
MKYDNQLRYAVNIIEDYDGRTPLSPWLKEFFRNNKQMGSKDRKTVSEMVYGYYRLGHQEFSSVEQRVKAFINISDNLTELKHYFFPKAQSADIDYQKIFPYNELLSAGIDQKTFSHSFLVQPDLFVRVRPDNKSNVIEKLVTNGLNYEVCEENCIAFSNSTKLEHILDINREVIVQDRSSQKTGSFIEQVYEQVKNHPAVWDCCAGSGGKSILAYDMMQHMNLTVSDIRERIIDNLVKRFSDAGILNYESFVADLTDPNSALPATSYDLIIADVPCTGSGTWARTPEQLYFFMKEKIDQYTDRQKKIVSRVIPCMKENGYLLYITCSVFADENENMAAYIAESHSLKLVRSEIIKGYDHRADTLYAALFTN